MRRVPQDNAATRTHFSNLACLMIPQGHNYRAVDRDQDRHADARVDLVLEVAHADVVQQGALVEVAQRQQVVDLITYVL